MQLSKINILSLLDIATNMIVSLAGFHIDMHMQSNSIPYVIFPRKNTTTPDCICPIITYETCYDFSSCSCFNHTLFIRSTLACRNRGMTNVYRMRFFNFTFDVNGTLVHFIESFRSCRINDQEYFQRFYRKYIKSFRIIIGK